MAHRFSLRDFGHSPPPSSDPAANHPHMAPTVGTAILSGTTSASIPSIIDKRLNKIIPQVKTVPVGHLQVQIRVPVEQPNFDKPAYIRLSSFDRVKEQLDGYTFEEISAPERRQLLVSSFLSSATVANIAADNVERKLRDQLINLRNRKFEFVNFLYSDGTTCNDTPDANPRHREDGIWYVLFGTNVDPTQAVGPCSLADLSPFETTFALKLPVTRRLDNEPTALSDAAELNPAEGVLHTPRLHHATGVGAHMTFKFGTYCGDLNFYETIEQFEKTFGKNPTPLRLTSGRRLCYL